MSTSRKFLLLAGLTGLAMLGVHVTSANSEEQGQRQASPPPKIAPRLDVGKTALIEPKLANVVKNTTAPAPQAPPPVAVNPFVPQPPNGVQGIRPRLDVGKGGVIEPRLQFAVQHAFAGQLGTPNGGQFGLPAAPPPPVKTEFVNPKVEPGKVKWHKNLEEARAASLKSKKPVLIFQMMGKLDDQFC